MVCGTYSGRELKKILLVSALYSAAVSLVIAMIPLINPAIRQGKKSEATEKPKMLQKAAGEQRESSGRAVGLLKSTRRAPEENSNTRKIKR